MCGVNSLYSNPLYIDDISWCSWHIIFWHYIVPIYCLHFYTLILGQDLLHTLLCHFWWHVHTQELKANLILIWRLLELASTESRVVYENLLWWTFLKKYCLQLVNNAWNLKSSGCQTENWVGPQSLRVRKCLPL